jgi:hypothetical protein
MTFCLRVVPGTHSHDVPGTHSHDAATPTLRAGYRPAIAMLERSKLSLGGINCSEDSCKQLVQLQIKMVVRPATIQIFQ